MDSRRGLSFFSLRLSSAGVSSIYHFRVGRCALMAPLMNAPGTVKLGNYNWNPEFYGFLDQPFVFLSLPPVRGGFVYLPLPRWALGVNGRPFGTPPGTPRNPTERHGTVKLENCE